MIQLTDNADIHLSSIVAENKVAGVKLAVNSGGCSGFKYDFSFDNKTDENDLKHENIIIDKSSLNLLEDLYSSK